MPTKALLQALVGPAWAIAGWCSKHLRSRDRYRWTPGSPEKARSPVSARTARPRRPFPGCVTLAGRRGGRTHRHRCIALKAIRAAELTPVETGGKPVGGSLEGVDEELRIILHIVQSVVCAEWTPGEPRLPRDDDLDVAEAFIGERVLDVGEPQVGFGRSSRR